MILEYVRGAVQANSKRKSGHLAECGITGAGIGLGPRDSHFERFPGTSFLGLSYLFRITLGWLKGSAWGSNFGSIPKCPGRPVVDTSRAPWSATAWGLSNLKDHHRSTWPASFTGVVCPRHDSWDCHIDADQLTTLAPPHLIGSPMAVPLVVPVLFAGPSSAGAL